MLIEKPWLLKSMRSESLLQELDQKIDSYIETRPFRAEVESWDGKVLVTNVYIDGKPDAALSPLIGDIIHNQRSTLDSIYFALIKFKAGSRLEEFEIIENNLYFPVLDNETDFNKYLGIKQFGDEQLKLALKQFQPFHLVPDETNIELRKSHYYKQLIALSNLDKHRGVNVVHMVADDITLMHSGELEYLGARKIATRDSKHLKHEFHFENPLNSPQPVFDVKVSLALESPKGFEWVTSHSASSLLHTIQSQNNWAIAVTEYILGGGESQLLAQLYT
ncbi:hypothetical protein MCEMZLE2_01416 [Candidatus Nanopelagicaceae bacterium]